MGGGAGEVQSSLSPGHGATPGDTLVPSIPSTFFMARVPNSTYFARRFFMPPQDGHGNTLVNCPSSVGITTCEVQEISRSSS